MYVFFSWKLQQSVYLLLYLLYVVVVVICKRYEFTDAN